MQSFHQGPAWCADRWDMKKAVLLVQQVWVASGLDQADGPGATQCVDTVLPARSVRDSSSQALDDQFVDVALDGRHLDRMLEELRVPQTELTFGCANEKRF